MDKFEPNDPKNHNSNGGKNRDWGYASYYDDDKGDTHLIYTSYEKNGSVNRYPSNNDGGHGHEHWNNKDSYDAGDSSDWSRSESNDSPDPDTGEVQDNGGCYLTAACMQHYQTKFDDNCCELKTLRWFRDNHVSLIDKLYYYSVAPQIVKCINKSSNKEKIYHYIYSQVIDPCVKAIQNKNYDYAYKRYKDNVQRLRNYFVEKKHAVNLPQYKLNSTIQLENKKLDLYQ